MGKDFAIWWKIPLKMTLFVLMVLSWSAPCFLLLPMKFHIFLVHWMQWSRLWHPWGNVFPFSTFMPHFCLFLAPDVYYTDGTGMFGPCGTFDIDMQVNYGGKFDLAFTNKEKWIFFQFQSAEALKTRIWPFLLIGLPETATIGGFQLTMIVNWYANVTSQMEKMDMESQFWSYRHFLLKVR